MVAIDAADSGLALPALAADFSIRALTPLDDSLGQLGAQVKVATNALFIGAVEHEQRFGIRQIEGAFDFTMLRRTVGSEIGEDRAERLQG